MLERVGAGARKILRQLAGLSFKSLTREDRARLIEHYLESTITEVSIDGTKLRFVTPTPTLLWRAKYLRSKEPETMDWIKSFSANDVLWDIGANIGAYSICAAALKQCHVLAFEPSADNYMVLCRNVEANGLQSHITPYCMAFAGSTKIAFLNSNSRDLGAALNQFGDRGERSLYWTGKLGSCVQGMLGYRIDNFIQQFKPLRPVHLKIDVDGLELDILHGAMDTLSDRSLKSVMVELNPDDNHEIETVISVMTKEAGFKLELRGKMQMSADAKAQNHLFVR